MIHITHYDPVWWAGKARERPFELKVGLDVIDAMCEAALNTLVIDCADGLKYKSHGELKRHYSVATSTLKRLVKRCESRGIEVVPKLNFAQSGVHWHNHWFRPHNALFDSEEYFRIAFEVIDEIIETSRPREFFHIGMDEDHWRSTAQYVSAIKTLRRGLKKRGLRTIIWNDSACDEPQAAVHKEKSLVAEERIPKDIVQVVWDYSGAQPRILRRIVERGFELWGAPGHSPKLVAKMNRALLRSKGKGILLTCWCPCIPRNRAKMLELIRTCGPLCSGSSGGEV